METLYTRLIDAAFEKYGSEPEHPWIEYPDYTVLRHEENKKWYALLTVLPRRTLGLSGSGKVPAVNLKCDPLLIGSLRNEPGFFPAYHMNRFHWITVLLDGSVDFEEISELLDVSYRLTGKKEARGK